MYVAVATRLARRPAAAVLLFVAALALVAVALRLTSGSTPLGADAGAYLYVGRLIVHGGAPYRDAIDDKGPLTYLLFAVLWLLAKTSVIGVRGAAVGFTVVAALAVAGYLRCLGGRAVALAGGALCAAVASAPWDGASVDTEQLAIAPMAGAWWMAARSGIGAAAGAGALVAAATLMNVGFAPVAIPVAFELWRGDRPERRAARFAAATAGALAVVAPVLAWLAAQSALGAMAHDVLGFGADAVAGPLQVPRGFARHVGFEDAGLVGLAALGGLVAVASRRHRRAGIGALLWIVVMLGRAKLSPYDGPDFAHHYYPLVPGVAAGLALGGAAMADVLRPRVGRRAVVGMVAGAAVAVLTAYVIVPAARSRRPPDTITPAAAFVEAHTRSFDRIVVSGYAPQVYWLADRDASVPLFSVPRFGAVSLYGRDVRTYRLRRLADFLGRPPAAIVVPPQRHDQDVDAVRRLLPYRPAFRRCALDQGSVRCTRVWLLAPGARSRGYTTREVDGIIAGLMRSGAGLAG